MTVNAESSYHALIVLSNEMSKEGVLNPISAARADRAAAITHQVHVPFVVTCGWAYRPDCPMYLADAFKNYLIEKHAIDPAIVLTETQSKDTVGEAVFTRLSFALPRGWRKICVVTSGYHLERAKEIFQFVYGDSYLLEFQRADVAFDPAIVEKEASSLEAFRKTFLGIPSGDIDGILGRLRERHPFYNGAGYEKI